ncbi:cell envelope biogenesis protein OmpA [Myxococcus xanthus]|uniref:Cell envelope biogenesis protein OmpA n=2 Tax=Myxococcus xanthus TaxID=34 RepID=A0AAE6KVL5_MYXXA|nr:cell envelope biogenesis protein OmpA [Myxococcus xanthus]QDE78555.1 cell envelope biogenesis protein OmpA [Myxococcus xanthus]QDF07862.1 cell envelope biogenesis protein OmpA [Myxococcus xanthus]
MAPTMKPTLCNALCVVLLVLSAPALAAGGLSGTVVRASDRSAIPEVRVTATSPVLPEPRSTVTDANGAFRFPQLEDGVYSLRFEKESFQALIRTDITVKAGHAPPVDVALLAALLTRPSVLAPAPVDDDRGRAPAWALQHLPVLVPDGAWQTVYRASLGKPGSGIETRGFGVNPTIDTEESRVSEFPVAVDTSAYAVARDHLSRDVFPAEGAVRTEAFINSFNSGDEGEPYGPFLLYVEGFPSPSRKGYHVVRITVKAREPVREVGVQVEFSRQAVARYRLLGYEYLSPNPEPLDPGDDTALFPLAAGQSVTTIHEVKLRGPSIAFGMLRVRYEQSNSSIWRRVQMLMPSSTLRSDYARAAPSTRLAYVASAFAEKLRGSFWTRALDWPRLLALWEGIGEPLRARKDVAQLGALIRKAQSLDTRKERFERLMPSGSSDFDDVPSLGN